MTTATATDLFAKLHEIRREISVLSSCGSLLGWDEQTQMPHGGAAFRAEQFSTLRGLTHKMATDPEIGDLLSEIESDEETMSDAWKAANIRELRRNYDKAVKVPGDLVKAIAKETSLGHSVWVEARTNDDFSSFLPQLEKIIDLKQQRAEAVGYDTEPYDALLDDFEPGTTAQQVADVFTPLREELVKIIQAIAGSDRKPDTSIVSRSYPVEQQKELGRKAAEEIGFRFDEGRIDVAVHPFCSGIGPGDTRITTRYDANHFNGAFFGTLHEAGHGIYEQNIPTEHFGLPAGSAVSLGIHESQSRMWENIVGRSKPFWEYMYPTVQELFPEALGSTSLDDFYFAINTVEPSFIRVESDEATYNLHIMLRFEIELGLFRGDIKPADLPEAWNSRFDEYLGITPPNNSQGCLQDVHWSSGLFGYFPTYALGNLYAAQFVEQAEKDLGNLGDQFRTGTFSPLRNWLTENIHAHGGVYPAPELCERITEEPLSHEPQIRYLKAKFGPLYGIQ